MHFLAELIFGNTGAGGGYQPMFETIIQMRRIGWILRIPWIAKTIKFVFREQHGELEQNGRLGVFGIFVGVLIRQMD